MSFYLSVNHFIKYENTKCALKVLGATISVFSGKCILQEHWQWIPSPHFMQNEQKPKRKSTHTV